jgi:hypothetical protein
VWKHKLFSGTKELVSFLNEKGLKPGDFTVITLVPGIPYEALLLEVIYFEK